MRVPALLLICAVSLSGCALRATQGGAPPGTSTIGSAFEVRGNSDTFAALLITLGLISYSAGSDGISADAPTVLDPRRSVSEQDCTRPLEDTGGNLRCR